MSRTEPAVPAGEAVRDAAENGAPRAGAPAGHGEPRADASAGHTARRRQRSGAAALRRVVVPVLLVLAALFGAYGGGGPEATEVLPATSGAADPGAETHEAGEAEAAAPVSRNRSRHGAAPRDSGRRRGPTGSDIAVGAPAPVPAPSPRDDALRCVVMRC
ncbi:hypothetical protein [Streptomyces sp. NBC_01353]|uniref:hypothetical protein n=1 Tax=Streptomyces sp. NBC_01353 TaxID=2903835 RepID=UPI002E34D7F4|nr:hypothetical protein [Streptomyces sp. NBC_01353]